MKITIPARRRPRGYGAILACTGVFAVLAVMLPGRAAATAHAAQASQASQASQEGGQVPACTTLPASAAPGSAAPGPAALKPTTLTTIEQAYWCVFAHYYAGPVLDDRDLLAGAFAGLTEELGRLGMDQPDATMPALTGDRGSDLAAFAAVYQRVTSRLPATAAQRQDLAAATMTGMIAALDDNHARWQYLQRPPGATPAVTYGLGITTSPSAQLAAAAPQEALPPLLVTAVDPGSPAARHGVRPGDIIESVDGAPPFTDGAVSAGVTDLLAQQYPARQAVRITVRWPVGGARTTITISPAAYPAPASASQVTSRLLDGHIAYLRVPGFFPGTAGQVMAAISALGRKAALRGLILDMRGNLGGQSPAQLLGAFEHGTAFSYDCTITGKCTANYPDASVPLLHLPLAVLTDRNCFSACDAFSAAVRDLRLGTLIGTRTSGIVSGPAPGYLLNDGSVLSLPATHELSAHHEIINGIGVAPDYDIPLTARDIATRHDPDIAKALALFGN